MIASTYLVYLALVAFAKASVTIPSGLPDGVYSFNPDDGTHRSVDGKVVGRDTALPTPPSLLPDSLGNSAKLTPRWTGITCGSTVINSLDYSSAVSSLQGACDGKTKLGKGPLYAVGGDVKAFMCNYKKDNVCTVGKANAGSATDMLNALGKLNDKCSTTLISQKSPDHIDG